MRAVVAALLLAAAPLALAQVSLYCHRVNMRPLRVARRGVCCVCRGVSAPPLHGVGLARATCRWLACALCTAAASVAMTREMRTRLRARGRCVCVRAGVRVRVFKNLQPWRVCGATAVSRGLRQTSAR
jgi:hypothetical protein